MTRWTATDSGRSTSTGSTDIDLPQLLSRRGPVFSEADIRVVRPLAFELPDGRAYTYVPSDHTFSMSRGATSAHTVVTLSYEAWCAFVWELRSSFALLYAGEVATPQGSFGQLARWEPSLRVAFSGQDLYDLDDPAPLQDAGGGPLDLTRSFTLDDPRDEIAAFLSRGGIRPSAWSDGGHRGRGSPSGCGYGGGRRPARRPSVVVDHRRRPGRLQPGQLSQPTIGA